MGTFLPFRAYNTDNQLIINSYSKIVTLLTQNLVVNKEFAFPKTTRFNRTFMELKGGCAAASRSRHLFQSHLYGIESRVLHRRWRQC